jgi:hypothetical protein
MKLNREDIRSKIIATMINYGKPILVWEISKIACELNQLVRYHIDNLVKDKIVFKVFKEENPKGTYYVLHDIFYDESLFDGAARGLLPIVTAIRESIVITRPDIDVEVATLNVLQKLVDLFLIKISQEMGLKYPIEKILDGVSCVTIDKINNIKTQEEKTNKKKQIIIRVEDPKFGVIEFVEDDVHNCPKCGTNVTCRKYIIDGADEYYDKVYCSKKCYLSDEKEEFEPFRGGISFETYCKKFNPEFKSRVRAFFGYKCVECGITEKEDGRKMSVHHVNYEKTACCDEETLPLFSTLCKKHHAMSNHNREYWNEHLEKIINDKYGGKCYFTKLEMSENNFTTI